MITVEVTKDEDFFVSHITLGEFTETEACTRIFENHLSCITTGKGLIQSILSYILLYKIFIPDFLN